MSSIHLAFSSEQSQPLSALAEGARATVMHLDSRRSDGVERLQALGVTRGAAIVVLQTFPGIVFLCDQTELAVERAVAETILVRLAEG
jgi:Fe2+ transport system protein FeoA